MSYSAAASKPRLVLSKLSRWLLLAVGLTIWLASQAAASNTTITTRVCETAPGLTIAQPVSDSVVTSNKITAQGQVSQVSQIEIFINGHYSLSVAIGMTQTEFTTSFTVPAGTHTIEFIGHDACSAQTVTRVAVITYQPVIEPNPPTEPGTPSPRPTPRPPSHGSEVPTEVIDQPGVIVGRPIDGDKPSSNDGFVVPPLIQSLIKVSDFEALGKGNIVLNILRLIGLIAGMFLIIGASGLVGLLARWRDNEVKRWHLRAVQVAGLLLVLGALVI